MPELTVGAAARLIGVPLDALKDLLKAGSVKGRQEKGGTWYLDTADLPEKAFVVEDTERRLALKIRACLAHTTRFDTEVEALRLDCQEALENLHAPLGNDLLTGCSSGTALDETLRDLRTSTLDVILLNRQLRSLDD